MKQNKIVILDLGNDNNSYIARKIRSLGVYSEIFPYDTEAEKLASEDVKGIILNYSKEKTPEIEAIRLDEEIFKLQIPVLAVGGVPDGGADFIASWPGDEAETDSLLRIFIFEKCRADANWNMKNFIADQIGEIRKTVGDKKILLALSGGVDSSVVAKLIIKAVGAQLVCVHVDHGLMRKNESQYVIGVFEKELGANLIHVDAAGRFLDRLHGVSDPEEKRKIIGAEFISVFEEEAKKLNGIEFLAQGTIYPDIVESGSKFKGPVKSHHNAGGLPEDLNFKLVEPLYHLFKDEVRACGLELGLPHDMVFRQPFPGPGLGVRCLGAITKDRLEAVRESDAILHEEFKNAGLDSKVWQYFTLIPDFKSTGVKNNERSYEWPVIIRAVNTVDAMTATVEQIEWPVLLKITDRILAEVPGVNRVCYDLSPKPCATIEWE